jgi:hypothetical protein
VPEGALIGVRTAVKQLDTGFAGDAGHLGSSPPYPGLRMPRCSRVTSL